MKARDVGGRARNMTAILDYCSEKRPDMLPQIKEVMEVRGGLGDAFISLLCLGFESGREFQKDNPELPLGGGAHYLPKDLRPAEFP